MRKAKIPLVFSGIFALGGGLDFGGVDFDAGAGEGTAREVSFLGFYEMNGTVDGGMDGVVAGKEGTWAGDFGTAGLADEDFASFDFLAAKTFDAEALAGIVVNIFGGSASFDM